MRPGLTCQERAGGLQPNSGWSPQDPNVTDLDTVFVLSILARNQPLIVELR